MCYDHKYAIMIYRPALIFFGIKSNITFFNVALVNYLTFSFVVCVLPPLQFSYDFFTGKVGNRALSGLL